MQTMWKEVKSKMIANGWCYEQVCLSEMFKFSTNLIGKLAYSTSSTDLNHKCLIEELNFFLFFFVRWENIKIKL